MERSEPTFVPEWYKVSNSSAAGSGNLSHQSGFSLQSDEHNIGFSSRSRLTVSICDYDAPRLLSFSEKTSSSFRKSASSNGYIGREKDFSSRAYNSFGRNHRDREWDREKDHEIHDRDRPLLPDNGFGDYPDVLIPSKSEKDSLRRSQSMLSGRRPDSWLKRAGHDLSNGVPVGERGRISGITKSSFEREFPSLGAEEKHAGSDVIRAEEKHPGLSSAIHNLPVTASTIIGADGWTSVLAEVPIVGGDGLISSSALEASSIPTVSSASTALNMAETIAQAPARARTVAQLPSDSQKIEELHRQQILKLRPMTPSMPKNLGVNLAEKSKTKASKMTEYSTVKVGQHLSSQLVNHHTLRSNIKSDVNKTSQSGNFHVLNREKNGVSSTGKDYLYPRNGCRVAASPSGIPLPAISDLAGQVHPKVNVNGKASALNSSSFGEKKLSSQAQNRNDFFNSLRKKTLSSQENANQDAGYKASAPSLDKLDEEVAADDKAKKDVSSMTSALQCSAENGSCSGSFKAAEEPERLVPDEEEAAFLRSLGWEENAGEEALTPEEIESFLSEYEKKMPVSKLKIGCSAKLSSSSETQVEASFC